MSKKTEKGGVKAILTMSKYEQIFFRAGFPKQEQEQTEDDNLTSLEPYLLYIYKYNEPNSLVQHTIKFRKNSKFILLNC